jgi:Hypervirulence associated proteins TUDOR domain
MTERRRPGAGAAGPTSEERARREAERHKGTRGRTSEASAVRFRPGDRVSWRSHGETVTGVVEEEITERTQAAKRTVAASKDHPQYRVRSDKSGGEAVHRPEALRRER